MSRSSHKSASRCSLRSGRRNEHDHGDFRCENVAHDVSGGIQAAAGGVHADDEKLCPIIGGIINPPPQKVGDNGIYAAVQVNDGCSVCRAITRLGTQRAEARQQAGNAQKQQNYRRKQFFAHVSIIAQGVTRILM